MIVSAVTAAWVSSALRQPATVSSTVQVQESPFQEKVAFETEQRAREAAKRAAQEAREQLEIEFAAVTAAAERANQAQIDAARTASEAARVAQEARDNLDRERAARAAAAQHDEDLQKHAAEAERAREAAERAAQAKTALVVGPAGMITSKPLPSQEKALPEPAQPPALAPARTEDPERPALPSAEEKAHAESALTLGEKYFVDGRVLVAREFFRRAVDAGLAAGALRLAATYDPLELERLRVQGIVPDRALARRWYQRARELGAPEAEERLAKLGDN